VEAELEPSSEAGAVPVEPDVSSAGVPVLKDQDSVLRGLPVSSITPDQESFDGKDESEGISDHGAYG
jgi:hypothetical protein